MHFIILLMSKFFDAFKGVVWYFFGGGGEIMLNWEGNNLMRVEKVYT